MGCGRLRGCKPDGLRRGEPQRKMSQSRGADWNIPRPFVDLSFLDDFSTGDEA